uniref:Molybdenum cofactor sulfurase n=1 Tax=Ciona savignyi TaxID=51511 RepID=H2YX42_CIOSA
YLDHTGSTLYAKSQIDAYTADLQSHLYGNPHSGNPSSEHMADIVRGTVLNHFNVTNDQYDCVFTSGATGALRVLAENFEWTKGKSKFVYLEDNHTSVVGIREPVETQNSKSPFHLQNYDAVKVKEQKLNSTENLSQKDKRVGNIFAYPAQSNFSGTKYPLFWISEVKKGEAFNLSKLIKLCPGNPNSCNWYVLLDAAAYVSCSKLDLTEHPADFVCISFYKMFGFPTGLGCLLVRKSAAEMLTNKRYFGGGSPAGYLANCDFFKPRTVLHSRLEDGTISFLDIMALKHGFNFLNQVDKSMVRIQDHTFSLAQRLYRAMNMLKHHNGAEVVKIYSHTDYTDSQTQGAIITFNVNRADGSCIGFNHVLQLAASKNIHLRSGCFCNVGACVSMLNLTPENMKTIFQSGHSCGDHIDIVDGKPVGAIRASLGYMSSTRDVDSLVQFIKESFLQNNSLVHWVQEMFFTHENNLSAEVNDEVYYDARSSVSDSSKALTLEKIFLYPVKSCRAIEVSFRFWTLCETGLTHDRMWMIVNDYGVCLTQKRENLLALIQPSIDLEAGTLTLESESCGSVEVPLNADDRIDGSVDINVCESKVCGDRVSGYDCGEKVSKWLSEFLGYKCYLIRKNNETRFAKKRKEIENCSNQTLALTNGAQYLMLTSSSVKFLQEKINSQLSEDGSKLGFDEIVDRFRCNFLVSGCKAFEEESWSKIFIRNQANVVKFMCSGLSNRCSMICVDKTGQKGLEPLRTL